jgi:hypothetical protein
MLTEGANEISECEGTRGCKRKVGHQEVRSIGVGYRERFVGHRKLARNGDLGSSKSMIDASSIPSATALPRLRAGLRTLGIFVPAGFALAAASTAPIITPTRA